MKPIFAAAALAVLAVTSPATAQDQTVKPADKMMSTTTDAAGNYYTESEQNDFLASKLMGARVYATTKDFDDTQPVGKVSTEWMTSAK